MLVYSLAASLYCTRSYILVAITSCLPHTDMTDQPSPAINTLSLPLLHVYAQQIKREFYSWKPITDQQLRTLPFVNTLTPKLYMYTSGATTWPIFQWTVLVSYLGRTANELAKRANPLERSVANSKPHIFQRVEYKPTEVHVHQRGSLLLCVLGSWNYTEMFYSSTVYTYKSKTFH